jgi:hypothetical protein
MLRKSALIMKQSWFSYRKNLQLVSVNRPDILFKNNVDIIGATRITEPGLVFDIVSEGGTGYHLFKYCAQKIYIFKDNEN